jgi:hypothetical protein
MEEDGLNVTPGQSLGAHEVPRPQSMHKGGWTCTPREGLNTPQNSVVVGLAWGEEGNLSYPVYPLYRPASEGTPTQCTCEPIRQSLVVTLADHWAPS